MLQGWACMLQIISSSVLSPHFQSGLLILPTDEWLASCGTAAVFLLSEYSSNIVIVLWHLHFCTVEVVGDGTYWYFWCFLHNSHFSLINFCCFLWSTCLTSVAQYTSSFFLFPKIPDCCPCSVHCLPIGSDRFSVFSQPQNVLILLHRQLPALHVGLPSL